MTLDEATRIDELADIYSDLPDGAFWAALEENGIYPEDVDEAQEILESQNICN
jgi:hypothetical protein